MDDVIPSGEVVARIHEHFPLEPIGSLYAGEVAKRWRYADGAGEIGVISSVTHAFCASCTRARLSTDGQVYTCLFAQRGYDLKALVRGGATEEALAEALRGIWQHRADRYSEIRTTATAKERKVEMSFIGG
jgi:cyclic pyranopterin phosphate synthase